MSPAAHRDLHELVFTAGAGTANPFLDLRFQVSFTRPDGRVSTADGFYDHIGDTGYRYLTASEPQWRPM